MRTAGISVAGRLGANEVDVPDDDLENHLVDWPLKIPKRAQRKGGGKSKKG